MCKCLHKFFVMYLNFFSLSLLPLSIPDTAMELSSDVGVSLWFLGNRPKLRTKRTRLLSRRFSGLT